MEYLFPAEIFTNMLGYMSIIDLVRLERTCRLFQSYALYEIEKRIIKSESSKHEWGILIHLSQATACPIRFDSKTKRAYYSIKMDPVKIKTMFDHRRSIHCSLLRKKMNNNNNNKYQAFNGEDSFVITVEKGMKEGKTIEFEIENKTCQVHAALTRLPPLSTTTTMINSSHHHSSANELQQNNKQKLKFENELYPQQPIKSMAPAPLTYTLQITELSLPLSTIALA
ncbi:uncharacterized protein BX663DRAFT_557524 [Cokeromyces recurvatus]|uniref:uncharacterized protein n=1 Tax=Cokeromyces recurvatus TaxID=90255 RepID=UPI002220EA68|nr:uncharacterized protein BX663DRAFT_557524 [Cokeromyces recurvatus]KAI7906885.1 hypothetical protein BX663DRAFT_557524 [Cokeromyces recurvatus]